MQTAHFSNDHFHRVRSVLKRGFNINIALYGRVGAAAGRQ